MFSTVEDCSVSALSGRWRPLVVGTSQSTLLLLQRINSTAAVQTDLLFVCVLREWEIPALRKHFVFTKVNHEPVHSPCMQHLWTSCPLFVSLLTQKSWRPAEDVSDTIPRERALKSVSFQESVSVISDRPATMELESQQIQHGCPSNRAHSSVGVKVETPDSEVVQVWRFSEWDSTQMFSFLIYFLWSGAGVNTKTMTMKFIYRDFSFFSLFLFYFQQLWVRWRLKFTCC